MKKKIVASLLLNKKKKIYIGMALSFCYPIITNKKEKHIISSAL